MSSNALSVSALEQVSFQLFAESVKTHSSSTVCLVPRRRAAQYECATTRTVLVQRLSRVPLTQQRSCRLTANDDSSAQSLLR